MHAHRLPAAPRVPPPWNTSLSNAPNRWPIPSSLTFPALGWPQEGRALSLLFTDIRALGTRLVPSGCAVNK